MYADFVRFLKAACVLTVLALAVLVTLHLLDTPAGALVDWVVGLLSVWWLLLITTLPWTLYFDARAARREAAISEARGIDVDAGRLGAVQRVATRALAAALVLHAATAAGLYAVAAFGFSPVGYAGAALALGLTVARPSAHAYRYLAGQVSAFREETRFPREDVALLRERLVRLEATLSLSNNESWAAQLQERLDRAAAALPILAQNVKRLDASNQSEHARLEQEYRSALATVTEDRQFVEHLREIVRFVRRA